MRFPRPQLPAFGVSRADRATAAGPSTASKDAKALPKTCRICWELSDDDSGGTLVAPCACSGTMRYIHVRCLKQWLAARQGAPSATCDICHTRYQVPPGTPGASGLPVQAGCWWQEWLRGRYAEAGSLARRDPAKLLERAVQLSFTANAAIQGGVFAGRGAHQAFLASTRSLSPPLMAFLKWAPELILGSAAFPSLQFPILLSSTAILLAAAVEVVVCSAAAAYLGFLYGSSMGTLRMLHWTVRLSLAVPLKGGKLANSILGSLFGLAASQFRAGPRGAVTGFLAQVCLLKFLFGKR